MRRHSFLGTWRIWLHLGAREPFLAAIAPLAMLLSWGLVLSDVDLFNLIWYDNAGGGFDKDGNRYTESYWWINWMPLFAGGMAASLFWFIWVTTALVRLRIEREKTPGKIRRSEFSYNSSLFWFSLPGNLSFIPAFYSNGPKYDECGMTIEDRWPFLLGAGFGAFLFLLAFLFSPRSEQEGIPSERHFWRELMNDLVVRFGITKFFKFMPVTTVIFAFLMFSDLLWRQPVVRHSDPSRMNESPVPVSMVWWLFGLVICTFESIQRVDEDSEPGQWGKRIRSWLARILGVGWIVLLIRRWCKYDVANNGNQEDWPIWMCEEWLVLVGFLFSSFLLTWWIHRKARLASWKKKFRRRLQWSAAVLLAVTIAEVVFGFHQVVLGHWDPITWKPWLFSEKAVIITSTTLFVLSIVLANWIDSAPPTTPTTIPNWTLIAPRLSQNAWVAGGMGTVNFSVQNGERLPAGLALDPNTGVITGRPTTVEAVTFHVVVTGIAGGPAVQEYSVSIEPEIPPNTAVGAQQNAAPAIVPAAPNQSALAVAKDLFQGFWIWLWRQWNATVAAPSAAKTWHDARPMFYSAATLYIVLVCANLLRDANETTRYCYLPGSVSVFFLLGGITLGLGRLGFYRPTIRVGIIFTLILIYGFSYGWQRHPHHLAELEELGYYDRKPCILPLDQPPKDDDDKRMPQLQRYAVYRKQRVEGLIVDKDEANNALENWKTQFPGPSNPPLIIVTTSGGASGSAMFTVKVLTALEQQYPGFSRHVRIITGASGGMVGAAYFRSQLPKLRHYRGGDKNQAEIEETPLEKDQKAALFNSMNARIRRDFLSPIAQEWVFKDLPIAFSPRSYSSDRGQRLQQVWKKELDGALEITFEELAAQERQSPLPSLIFSPLFIEDGRQLLISTLDLDHLVEPEAREWGGVNDHSVRKLSAVEFFKLFPDSFPKLRLASAARLNATFAWLSPSVTLPTIPPRRVVDAGYLDNHGIMTAMMWLYYHRAWVQANTSRVILLNIRVWDQFEERGLPPVTGPELDRIRELKAPDCWQRPAFSFSEFTTPLTGLENARSFGAVYRNDRATEGMKELLNRWVLPPGGEALVAVTGASAFEQLSRARSGFHGLERYTIIGDISGLPLNWTLSKYQADKLDERVDKAMKMAIDQKVPLTKITDANEWNAQQFDQLLKSIKPAPKP